MMLQDLEPYIIAELELAALLFLFAIFLLFIVFRRYKKIQRLLAKKVQLIKALQQQLAASKPANSKNRTTQTNRALIQELTDANQSLTMLKQQVTNLEKFKTLYFDLEESINRDKTIPNRNADITTIKNTLEAQNLHIDKLKNQLANAIEKHQPEEDLKASLTDTIYTLEHMNHDLSRQLDIANQEKARALEMSKEINAYRHRVQQLEATELRLKNELNAHRKQIQIRKIGEIETQRLKALEIESMRKKFKNKDSELEKLRKECEVIGQQYEALASRSQQLSSENSELTHQQQSEMKSLKARLEESQEALTRKSTEFEILEENYLELENLFELEDSEMTIEKIINERQALVEESRKVSKEIETASNEQQRKLLTVLQDHLQKQLTDKEHEISHIKQEHKELKKQFFEVAQEGIKHKHEAQKLKAENQLLKNEANNAIEYKNNLAEKIREFEALNIEHSKLEKRYLALIAKE